MRLLTLGSVSLRDADGGEVASVLTQPKRFALLVYLACAKPRGLQPRDRVLGMFWPELDQDRARAALSQSLYVLKKALGADAIVTRGADQVGVNHDVLWCDAAAFEAEMDGGEADVALQLYRGDFLPGFYLSEASGFEDWLERERRRLGGLAEAAAWQMATRSQAVGDHRTAIAYARQAFDLSVHDESAVRRLLVLLDAAGDRAGALDEYDRYAKRLRSDFDADPAPETQAVVAEIRARQDHRELTPLAPLPAAATMSALPSDAPIPLRKSKARWLTVAGALTVIAALLVFALWPRHAGDVVPKRIAVLPFSHIGASETRYLSDGVVELLAAKLDGAGDLRAVDPHAMLERIGSDTTIAKNPTRARAIAREFNAGYYLLGNVTQAGASIHLRAVLYDRAGRALSRAESTAADESHLFSAVDDIARALLSRLEAGPGRRLDQVAGMTTRSIPALKYYLEGDKARRTGRFDVAAQNLQEAIREDSTFALAYYRMALVAEQIGSSSLQHMLISSAVRHSARLNDHDRRLVTAYAELNLGSPDVAEGQYRNIVALFPDDTEAWHQLGELVFHTAPTRGRSVLEAWRPFERVMELDPDDGGPQVHFARLAAMRGDVARLKAAHRTVQHLEPGSSREAEVRLLLAYVSETRERQLQELEAWTRKFSPDDLWNWAGRVAEYTENPQVLLDAANIMARPEQPVSVQAVSQVLQAQAFAALGQWRNARQAITRLQRLDPIIGSLLGGYLAVLPFAPLDRPHLEAARADLMRGFPAVAARTMVLGELTETPHAAMRHGLLGLVELRLGNTAAAEQRADSVDALRQPTQLVEGVSLPVRAAIQMSEGESQAALARIEAFRRQHNKRGDYWGFPTFGNSIERYLRAELLLAVGREQEALKWFGSMNQDINYNYFYFAPAHLRQAEILDRMGQREEAKRHYTRFVELWRNADAESQGDVRRAMQRLKVR